MSECLLFSYGTLRLPVVQLALFGRLIEGREDTILGWRSKMIEITDPDVIAKSGTRWHPLVEPSDDPDEAVEVMFFAVSEDDLTKADAYEVDYSRLELRLRSGDRAYFYAAPTLEREVEN